MIRESGERYGRQARNRLAEATDPSIVGARLEIRTTRYFRYEDGAWRQFHHHGSIDDTEVLVAYQRAVHG